MRVLVGTTVKYAVSITQGLGDYTMDNPDVKFSCEFYCTKNRSFTVDKDHMFKQDSSTYIVSVDTESLGVGDIHVRMTISIPDKECSKGIRTEVHDIITDVVLYR